MTAAAEFAEPTAEHPVDAVFIVIAAYREAEVIAGVVEHALAVYPNVIVVDDGSPDATAQRARDAGATVLVHPINRGQGAALQTGITWALKQGAGFVVTFDGDGQHDIADARRMIDQLVATGADAAFGNRFTEHADSVPASRRALLKLAVVFSRVMSGVRLTDAHNGLRAMRASMAAELDITLDGMAHASEIADKVHRSGRRYIEVPVHIRYTDYARAKGQRWSAAFSIATDYLLGRVMR